jgi:RNA polymerase sigma factor (sigma-70 family)
VNELLRTLTPQVLGVLVRRGADFASAEDAVQEALLEAFGHWPDGMPDDPKGWLIRVAGRKLIDAQRSEAARRRRELRVCEQSEPDPVSADAEETDDTLLLLSRCCHPALTAGSAIALTLRAVGGLTTAQIAQAFLVPESTMAQRISRAKRSLNGERFDRPGDIRAVLRVLYLIFNEGFTGDIDMAAEAIRLTRQLAGTVDEPEVAGLLALMLLHHARQPARRADDGSLVPLAAQDRNLWDKSLISEGVTLLQRSLAGDRPGEYQVEAAIAALHDDARSAEETDWPQILEWYDELLVLNDSPVVRLNRAVAVGHVDGPLVGLRLIEDLVPDLPRREAAAAYLQERAGNLTEAARLYAAAADRAATTAERDHLIKQAARLNCTAILPETEVNELEPGIRLADA